MTKHKIADKKNRSIKWRRSSQRISNAAENQRKMEEQLLREAYTDLKPGQLVRITYSSKSSPSPNSIPELMQSPTFTQFKEGDILMFLRWAENETLESTGDTEYSEWINFMESTFVGKSKNLASDVDRLTVTGPVWLFQEKVFFRRIKPNDFEPIILVNESEEI